MPRSEASTAVARQARAELAALANPERAAGMARFFKMGPGEYGQGDHFMGITVPVQRALAKRFVTMPLGETEKLLHSKLHEERSLALFILSLQMAKAEDRAAIVKLYLASTAYVNNWDLVDLSARPILGDSLRYAIERFSPKERASWLSKPRRAT